MQTSDPAPKSQQPRDECAWHCVPTAGTEEGSGAYFRTRGCPFGMGGDGQACQRIPLMILLMADGIGTVETTLTSFIIETKLTLDSAPEAGFDGL
jgi:hypothetical protein